jgi:hypothetical protein
MAKISYEAIERSVIRSMRKWAAEKLQAMTVRKAKKLEQGTFKRRSPPERLAFLKGLQRDLDLIYQRNKHIYRDLGFPFRHLKFAMAMYAHLQQEQWNKVETLRLKLDTYMEENPFLTEDGEPESPDETLVESERRRQEKMHHNRRSGWLPS